MARRAAAVYNGWNLFVRLAQPHQHFEAITSRPLLLHGIATQTQHAGQRRLTIISTHAKQSAIQAVLTNLAEFLRILRATAEQLIDAQLNLKETITTPEGLARSSRLQVVLDFDPTAERH